MTGSTTGGASTIGPAATVEATTAPSEVRVVALGEELLLADLLALGITPVASTAAVTETGFQGLGELDATGIEVLSATEPHLSAWRRCSPTSSSLSSSSPTRSAWIGSRPRRHDRGAEGAASEEQLAALGPVFGRNDAAAALVAEVDAARAELRRAVAATGCEVSVATSTRDRRSPPGPTAPATSPAPSSTPGARWCPPPWRRRRRPTTTTGAPCCRSCSSSC